MKTQTLFAIARFYAKKKNEFNISIDFVPIEFGTSIETNKTHLTSQTTHHVVSLLVVCCNKKKCGS